jgi:4,5-dihydroxyphthalate decarboxylase
VGVNAYTPTSGIWIRGVLEDEYGLDLSRIEWVTMSDGYLGEYRDPENCQRAEGGATLLQLLLDGKVDAAVLGAAAAKDERLKPLFSDPAAATQAWYKKYGIAPMNHMLVAQKSLCQSRPDVVSELYRLFVESKRMAQSVVQPFDPTPYGIDANREALELLMAYAVRQKIIPRTFDVDDLFSDIAEALRS